MVLVAESGSTKTDWRLVCQHKIEHFSTDGINPFYQTPENITTILQQQLLPFLVEKEITEVHYYGTGITDFSKKNSLESVMKNLFPKLKIIEIESDIAAAARGLFGSSEGIACILGTGSNSAFYNGTEIEFQVHTLGFWLGDEGSGGYLGKVLITSYLQKELPDRCRQLFEAKLGKLERLTVLENAYKKPFPNRYFASFSLFLFEYRSEPFFKELIENAFRSFFEKYIVKYPNFQQIPIGFVGSIAFYHQETLRKIALEFGLQIAQIHKSPIDALVLFHAATVHE